MSKYNLIIEGGGDDPSNKRVFREAVSKFLKKATLSKSMPSIITGGSRSEAFKKYEKALSELNESRIPILVLDSEHVRHSPSNWKHLEKSENWNKPINATDDTIYLMETCMECWILADPGVIQEFFGKGFVESKLPKRKDLYNILPFDALKMLTDATLNCKNQYSKGTISYKLIASIDPIKVQEIFTQAKSLIEKLKS